MICANLATGGGWVFAAVKEGLLLSWGEDNSVLISVVFYPHAKLVRVVHLEEEGERYGETVDSLQGLLSNNSGTVEVGKRPPLTGVQSFAMRGEAAITEEKIANAVNDLFSDDHFRQEKRMKKLVQRTRGIPLKTLAMNNKVVAWAKSGILRGILHLIAQGRFDHGNFEGVSATAAVEACMTFGKLAEGSPLAIRDAASTILHFLQNQSEASPTFLEAVEQLAALDTFVAAAGEVGILDSILAYYASHLQPGHSLFHHFQGSQDMAITPAENQPLASPSGGNSNPCEETGLQNSRSFNFGPTVSDNEFTNESPRVETWGTAALKKTFEEGEAQSTSNPKPLVPRLSIPLTIPSSTPALTRSTRRSFGGAGTDRSSAPHTARGFSSRILSPASSIPSSRKGEVSFRNHGSTDYKDLCTMIGKGLVLSDVSAIFHLRGMHVLPRISLDAADSGRASYELPQQLQSIATRLKPDANTLSRESNNVAAALFLKPPGKFSARAVNIKNILSGLSTAERPLNSKTARSLRRHAESLQRVRTRLLEILSKKKPEGDALVDLENVIKFLTACLASRPELLEDALDTLGEALLKVKRVVSGFGPPNLWRRSHVMVMLTALELFTEILSCSESDSHDTMGCLLAFDSPGSIWGMHFFRSVFSGGRLLHEIGSDATPQLQISCFAFLNQVVLLLHKLGASGYRVGETSPSHLLKSFCEKSKTAVMSLNFLMDCRQGFVAKILQKKVTAGSAALHTGALRLLTSVFALRACPILDDHAMVDFYIVTAFTNFVLLYRYDGQRKCMYALTAAYLELLSSLACNKTPEMSGRFQRLKFADLIIGEMSLEFQAAGSTSRPGPANDEYYFDYGPGSMREPTGPVTVPKLNMSGLKSIGKDVPDTSPEKTPITGYEQERSTPPREFCEASFRKEPKSKRTIDFTGDLEEDVEMLESMDKEVVNDERNSGSAFPIRMQPSPTAAPHPALQALEAGRQKSGIGVKIPSLKLPPRPANMGQEERGLQPHTVSDSPGGPPGLKFTGDLEEDVAMLEELEKEKREEHSARSPLRSGPAGGLVPDHKIRASGVSVKVPTLKFPLISKKEEPRTPEGSEESDLAEATETPDVAHSGRDKIEDRPARLPLKLPEATLSPKLTKESGPDSTSLSRQGSGLAALQESMGTMNAKAQLTILQPDKRNALLRKQQSEFHREGSLSDRDYSRRRNLHKIYHNADFHICMVETLLGLLLTRDGDLEKYVYELYPLEHKMPNFFFLLSQHLNHPSNQAVAVGLIQKIQKREGPLWNAMQQLLRLVVDGLFFGNAYRATTKIARGAYADVHRCRMPDGFHPDTVIVKAIDLPDTIYDANVIPDVFSEVSILQKLGATSCACTLYDYGIHRNRLFLILKNYPLSLRAWRATHNELCEGSVRLYLNVFMNVLRACETLANHNTVHYDIKGDNILVDPHKGTGLEEIMSPQTDQPPFSVVLADFGESKIFPDGVKPYSVRNRGTECIKSPEMLTISNATKKTAESYDRRRQVGVGKPADVWAVGCLLYELLTGDYLLHDPDWIRFFIRVTTEKENLLSPEKLEAISAFPEIKDLLSFILVRNPQRRPTMQDVKARVGRLLKNNFKNISHSRPAVTLQPRSEIADYTKTSPPAPGLQNVFPSRVTMPPGKGVFRVSSWLTVVTGGDPTEESNAGVTAILVDEAPTKSHRAPKVPDLCPRTACIKCGEDFEVALASVLCFARDSCHGLSPTKMKIDFRVAASPGLESAAWHVAMGLLLILEQDDLSTASKKIASASSAMPVSGAQIQSLLDFRDRLKSFPEKNGSRVFSCPCGSWRASVNREALEEQFVCDCASGEAAQCPCGSCMDLIEGLKTLHGCDMSVIVWERVEVESMKTMFLSRTVETGNGAGLMASRRVHVCCACRGVAYIQHAQKAWLVGNLDFKR